MLLIWLLYNKFILDEIKKHKIKFLFFFYKNKIIVFFYNNKITVLKSTK
jgi:hypothetical protein